MSIKIATIDDLDLIVSMAMKFAKASPYSDFIYEGSIKKIVTDILNGPPENGVILVYEDVGMLAGIAQKFIYGESFVATELAWWVDEDKRGTKVGAELMEAFEFWAKKVGCAFVTMTSLDDQIGSYYEKKGYELHERAYMKQL